jgi:hypothetical protein
MAVRVAVEARCASARLLRAAILGLIVLLLRERGDQQANLFGRDDAVEQLEIIVDGDRRGPGNGFADQVLDVERGPAPGVPFEDRSNASDHCSGAAPVSGGFLESALASSRSGTGRSIQRKPAPADVIIADSGNNLFAIGHSNRASAFTLLSGADHLADVSVGTSRLEPSDVTS